MRYPSLKRKRRLFAYASGSDKLCQDHPTMSFRLFIYYCALCGGGGAFLGWMLGRPINLSNNNLTQGLKGMFLGLSVAWALALNPDICP